MVASVILRSSLKLQGPNKEYRRKQLDPVHVVTQNWQNISRN